MKINDPIYQKKWRAANKEKMRAYHKQYREEKKEELRAKARQRKFGITPEVFSALLTAQDNRCAICRSSTPRQRYGQWHVDHDHVSGKVRGLLCHHCNTMLGLASDSPLVLAAAIRYLERQRGD